LANVENQNLFICIFIVIIPEYISDRLKLCFGENAELFPLRFNSYEKVISYDFGSERISERWKELCLKKEVYKGCY